VGGIVKVVWGGEGGVVWSKYRSVAKSVKIKAKCEEKFTEARKYSITLSVFRNVL